MTCQHSKVYNPILTQNTNIPMREWICRDCGATGMDVADGEANEYEAVKAHFEHIKGRRWHIGTPPRVDGAAYWAELLCRGRAEYRHVIYSVFIKEFLDSDGKKRTKDIAGWCHAGKDKD